MPKTRSGQTIYIDALALVPEKKSGIGFTLEQTLHQLAAKPLDICLVVPLGKAKYLRRYVGPRVRTKTIYLPARVMEMLLRLRLFPPADWLLGRGIYIFPNYRNWPLWRSRSMTYIYDIGFIKFPDMVQPKNQKYLSRYAARWTSRTDKIITITNQVRDEIEKELDQPYTKIAVVYCGVDPSVFRRAGADRIRAAKEKYRIPFKNYLLFVGNIEPRKNLTQLLDAYERLPAAVQEQYGLVLVGSDGWLNEKFNWRLERMQQKGRNVMKVREYVETEDLPALYSGAALLVHPAVYEGFGITPLEAMACETPVAAADIPAIREVAQEAALYFDPADPDSLKAAIVDSVTDDKAVEARVLEGKKRADELSWKQSAAALYEVIEHELKEGPHRRPVIRRLKAFYVATDKEIRKLLGDKAFSQYKPAQAASPKELRALLYRDFLEEQPSLAQHVLLKTYLFTKHVLSEVMKRTYRAARSI
jgi:glycosyltransferase involved in cell wall biosynthesis